jgi:GNAT superfamily N-acetyltransferase
MFVIRQATTADLDALAEAHRDSILALGASYYPPESVADWHAAVNPELYPAAMEAGEVFFIAVGNAAVLGFSSDYIVQGTVHGMSVYVRGSAARKGVGSALLRHAEAHALAAGGTSIEVDASLAGVDFYAANGFVETGRGEISLTTGRPIACVFMRKDIQNRSGASIAC